MQKAFRFDHLTVSASEHPEQLLVSLLIHQKEDLAAWSLLFAMLDQRLIHAAVILGRRGERILTIESSPNAPSIHAEARYYHLAIPPRTVTQLLRFFLEYYRDGVAEVDHTDVPAELKNAAAATSPLQQQNACITFRVMEADAPMSPQEALRWLQE